MNFDRPNLTRAFEGAGMQSGDAERFATEIYDAIHDNVATKVDIDNLRNKLAIAVRDLKIWARSVAVIVAGLLFGALLPNPGVPSRRSRRYKAFNTVCSPAGRRRTSSPPPISVPACAGMVRAKSSSA